MAPIANAVIMNPKKRVFVLMTPSGQTSNLPGDLLGTAILTASLLANVVFLANPANQGDIA